MLLDDHVLAADLWRHRLDVELEAAWQFDELAIDLERAGRPTELIEMARNAADDERDHAAMCAQIVAYLGGAPERTAERPRIAIGLRAMEPANRALYASVALCCVTETLSAALLLELDRLTTDPVVKPAVHRILKDEIRHGRLGWAHLAYEAERGDVSWLAVHVAPMLRAALASDLPMQPGASSDRTAADNHATPDTALAAATAVGILDTGRVRTAVLDAIDQVICPGLARFGVMVPAPALRCAVA